MAVEGESGEDIDLGDIRLQQDTTIRIAIEITRPSLEANRRPTIVLQGGRNGPRIVAQEIDGIMVLDQIPFDDGEWDISIYTNNRIEAYPGKFHVERSRRDQFLLLPIRRETLKVINQNRSEGALEVNETLLPEQSFVRDRRATGRILDPEGKPVTGAVVP